MLHAINISTWLTFFRIFLSPLVVVSIHHRAWMGACMLFCIAAITDFFDGYYARLYQQETSFGRVLDPVADKILLFTTLFGLYQVSDQQLIPLWFVLLVVMKDVMLVCGAIYLLCTKNYTIIIPSMLSKWITALLMIFFVYIMLIYDHIISADYVAPSLCFFAVMIVMILSDYVYKFFKKL